MLVKIIGSILTKSDLNIKGQRRLFGPKKDTFHKINKLLRPITIGSFSGFGFPRKTVGSTTIGAYIPKKTNLLIISIWKCHFRIDIDYQELFFEFSKISPTKLFRSHTVVESDFRHS